MRIANDDSIYKSLFFNIGFCVSEYFKFQTLSVLNIPILNLFICLLLEFLLESCC